MAIKNPYFRFKQFTVWHDNCGLKVCTESCILGSYVSVADAKKVLDIGTGTGLLALMIAQRNTQLQIDAIEIDIDAASQAKGNVLQSPFAHQIAVHHASIQDFVGHHIPQYDLIVSNPPFYVNHLKSPHSQTNNARHTDTLSFTDLAQCVAALLTQDGRFVVLLPPQSMAQFEIEAQQQGLFRAQELVIFSGNQKPIFRLITTFTKTPTQNTIQESLIIYDSERQYTLDFQRLLKDYYLIF